MHHHPPPAGGLRVAGNLHAVEQDIVPAAERRVEAKRAQIADDGLQILPEIPEAFAGGDKV